MKETMKNVSKSIKNALDSKNIPKDEIRPIDRRILELYFVGVPVVQIAKETTYSTYEIKRAIENPVIQRELRRMDKDVENDLKRMKLQSAREMEKASIEASKTLVNVMRRAKGEKGKIAAAVKILEYTHGKPMARVQGTFTPDEGFNDEEWKRIQEGLEDVEN